MSPVKAKPVSERFWPKVDKSGDCWEWTASKTPYGYGHFNHSGKFVGAHRLSWQLTNGAIPDGMQVDHICHNRGCVRPSHLRLVTPKQNVENQAGPNQGSKSGVRGVHWHKQHRKWEVRVCSNYTKYYGGTFADMAEAESAAIALRNRLFTHNELDKKRAA